MQLGFQVATLVEEQLHCFEDLAKNQRGEESWLVAKWEPKYRSVVFFCSRCNAMLEKGIVSLPNRYHGPARTASFFCCNAFKDLERAIRFHLNSKIHKQATCISGDLIFFVCIFLCVFLRAVTLNFSRGSPNDLMRSHSPMLP